jgi:hypothetical protein
MNLTRSAPATRTAALAGYPQCWADIGAGAQRVEWYRVLDREAFLKHAYARAATRWTLGSIFSSSRIPTKAINAGAVAKAQVLLEGIPLPLDVVHASWAEYWVAGSCDVATLATHLLLVIGELNTQSGVPTWCGGVSPVARNTPVPQALHNFSWMPRKAEQYDPDHLLFLVTPNAEGAVPFRASNE